VKNSSAAKPAKTKSKARARFRSLDEPDTLREFVRNIQEGIYITNPEGDLLDANPALLDMLGLRSLDELRSYNSADFILDPEERARELELLESQGSVRDFELRLRRADGQIRTVIDTCHVVRDPSDGSRVYHGVLVDITLRKMLESQLVEQSIRDPLTGCFNRRYLVNFEYRCDRSNIPWGCIMVDIDHFKAYNDTHGHQAGDVVLVKLSRFLMRMVRAEEGVVRMGGDEFLVLLAGANSAKTQAAARRVQSAALKERLVAFSLGSASREKGERLEKTIDRADESLLAIRGERRQHQRERRRT
jgi:diguanylate cyclase (GGDEF)-like protein/PAS domain S-box-containing protein